MTVLVAVSIVGLIAMGSFVMDVGSWFRAHRATQTVSDSAALAGAQKLPAEPEVARVLANEYGDKNGGGIQGITFESNTFANDTIRVRAERTAPGFLSRVLGIASVNVGADAVARAYNLGSARYAGPFAVSETHPFIRGSANCPCLGENFVTTIGLDTGNPSLGAFKIINIDGSYGGVGQSQLSEWILKGLDGYMGIGWYYSDPGAKFNPDQIGEALAQRTGSEILIPVYRSVRAQGAGYEYEVVGWIGFHVLSYTRRGSGGALTGYFTSVVWEGMPSESANNFFGATVVKLVG
ncbi:MAG TPA: pilus assembly protein TadG-related protein [Gaiellaceae bacterium]|nr:pilus assembly protein TadG-related protein [Gaiellaceae bacterium]